MSIFYSKIPRQLRGSRRNYFVPGVVVNIIALVTPIRPIELTLGKTLPFAIIGLLDALLVFGLAILTGSVLRFHKRLD